MTDRQRASYNKRWGAMSDRPDRAHRVFLERLYRHHRIVDEMLESRADSTRPMLEFGCGVGGVANWAAERGAKVVAVDVSDEAVRVAAERSQELAHPPEFHCADIAEFSFPGAPYDIIVSFDVIEHIPPERLPEVLRALAERLTDGGTLLITTPNCERVGNRLRRLIGRPASRYHEHEREYTVRELRDLAAAAGIEIVCCQGDPLLASGWTIGLPGFHGLSRILGARMPGLACGIVLWCRRSAP
ncbi:MAG TPA: class I SAM-dependent methyltransferase [Armatimonadota bacterium]|jgi:2-polyprenyl-3-methyl-5-hydroxy-6-metoxy-1,4-benzoquinol methylase|nr:class I SAM-dependent methyltransferase [Armatimonadota bacterium]